MYGNFRMNQHKLILLYNNILINIGLVNGEVCLSMSKMVISKFKVINYYHTLYKIVIFLREMRVVATVLDRVLSAPRSNSV